MAGKALLGNVTDNDLRLLRVFRAVVQCGGFSAAELELNINRSTISRHIKDLETRLGVTLCRRGRSGFALTPEGERVFASAAKITGAMEEFQHDVDELHQRLTGPLSIAIFDKTASNPACHIYRAFAAFDRTGPGGAPGNSRGADQRYRTRRDGGALPIGHHPQPPPFREPGLLPPVRGADAAVLR